MQCELGVLGGGDHPNSQPSRRDVKHPVTDAIIPRRFVRDIRLACWPRRPTDINHSVAASCQKQCHRLTDLHEKPVAPRTILLARIFKIFADNGKWRWSRAEDAIMRDRRFGIAALDDAIFRPAYGSCGHPKRDGNNRNPHRYCSDVHVFATCLERHLCRRQNKSLCTINARGRKVAPVTLRGLVGDRRAGRDRPKATQEVWRSPKAAATQSRC
jgi:hypothetical protein